MLSKLKTPFEKAVDAIKSNDTDALNDLLTNNPEIKEAFNEDRNSLLHMAIIEERTDMVHCLLDHNMDPNIQFAESAYSIEEQRNPLWDAHFSHSTLTEKIDILLKAGCASPLFLAVKGDQLESAKALLMAGATGHDDNHENISPFQLAIEQVNLKYIKLFIEHGGDVNTVDFNRHHPLDNAVKKGDLDLVKFLLSQDKIEINRTNSMGNTILFYANDVAIAEALLEAGFDINHTNNNNQTALNVAVYHSKLALTSFLIDRGAKVNHISKLYWLCQPATALYNAICLSNLKMVSLLIEKGANVNFSNSDSITPLLYATFFSNLNIVSLLIEKGAEINVSNKDGDTPLHLAAQGVTDDHINIASLLIEKGAHMNAVNNQGNTALSLAVDNSNVKTVSLLIEKGADVNIVNKLGFAAINFALRQENKILFEKLLLSGSRIDTLNARETKCLKSTLNPYTKEQLEMMSQELPHPSYKALVDARLMELKKEEEPSLTASPQPVIHSKLSSDDETADLPSQHTTCQVSIV